ncbi:hypothetical protein D3C85_1411720 [compost metagenome]
MHSDLGTEEWTVPVTGQIQKNQLIARLEIGDLLLEHRMVSKGGVQHQNRFFSLIGDPYIGIVSILKIQLTHAHLSLHLAVPPILSRVS